MAQSLPAPVLEPAPLALRDREELSQYLPREVTSVAPHAIKLGRAIPYSFSPMPMRRAGAEGGVPRHPGVWGSWVPPLPQPGLWGCRRSVRVRSVGAWALLPLTVPVPSGLGGCCPQRHGAGGEAAALLPEEAQAGIGDGP